MSRGASMTIDVRADLNQCVCNICRSKGNSWRWSVGKDGQSKDAHLAYHLFSDHGAWLCCQYCYHQFKPAAGPKFDGKLSQEDKQVLESHQRQHNFLYFCVIQGCTRWHRSKDEAKRHTFSHDSEIHKLKCGICSKNPKSSKSEDFEFFRSKAVLDFHKWFVHRIACPRGSVADKVRDEMRERKRRKKEGSTTPNCDISPRSAAPRDPFQSPDSRPAEVREKRRPSEEQKRSHDKIETDFHNSWKTEEPRRHKAKSKPTSGNDAANQVSTAKGSAAASLRFAEHSHIPSTSATSPHHQIAQDLPQTKYESRRRQIVENAVLSTKNRFIPNAPRSQLGLAPLPPFSPPRRTEKIASVPPLPRRESLENTSDVVREKPKTPNFQDNVERAKRVDQPSDDVFKLPQRIGPKKAKTLNSQDYSKDKLAAPPQFEVTAPEEPENARIGSYSSFKIPEIRTGTDFYGLQPGSHFQRGSSPTPSLGFDIPARRSPEMIPEASDDSGANLREDPRENSSENSRENSRENSPTEVRVVSPVKSIPEVIDLDDDDEVDADKSIDDIVADESVDNSRFSGSLVDLEADSGSEQELEREHGRKTDEEAKSSGSESEREYSDKEQDESIEELDGASDCEPSESEANEKEVDDDEEMTTGSGEERHHDDFSDGRQELRDDNDESDFPPKPTVREWKPLHLSIDDDANRSDVPSDPENDNNSVFGNRSKSSQGSAASPTQRFGLTSPGLGANWKQKFAALSRRVIATQKASPIPPPQTPTPPPPAPASPVSNERRTSPRSAQPPHVSSDSPILVLSNPPRAGSFPNQDTIPIMLLKKLADDTRAHVAVNTKAVRSETRRAFDVQTDDAVVERPRKRSADDAVVLVSEKRACTSDSESAFDSGLAPSISSPDKVAHTSSSMPGTSGCVQDGQDRFLATTKLSRLRAEKQAERTAIKQDYDKQSAELNERYAELDRQFAEITDEYRRKLGELEVKFAEKERGIGGILGDCQDLE